MTRSHLASVLQPPVDLDGVDVRAARRRGGGQHPQAGADLQRDAPGRPPSAAPQAEQVLVEQEVLAQLAVRAKAEPESRAARPARRAHQREDAGGVRGELAAPRRSTPRSAATARSVSST